MRAHILLVLFAALAATARPALADLQYGVSGEDDYRIGTTAALSRVIYIGTQRLSVDRHGKQARFDAQAHYTRSGDDGRYQANARFVQELLPNGTFEDTIDDDPDFLTILNQPFAIELDATTMRDLRALRGPVPFNATSPLGGQAVLHGFLRPARGGRIDGHPTIAVGFQADGPMQGPLPDRADATMTGRMRMDGTAYYSVKDAMLLALDANLTIVAQLRSDGRNVPVRIVYRRSIRAQTPANPPARTLPPTAVPTGAGTGSPATR